MRGHKVSQRTIEPYRLYLVDVLCSASGTVDALASHLRYLKLS